MTKTRENEVGEQGWIILPFSTIGDISNRPKKCKYKRKKMTTSLYYTLYSRIIYNLVFIIRMYFSR